MVSSEPKFRYLDFGVLSLRLSENIKADLKNGSVCKHNLRTHNAMTTKLFISVTCVFWPGGKMALSMIDSREIHTKIKIKHK